MSLHGTRVVLLDDLSWEDGEGTLEFRLTYAGLLLASNTHRDEKTARKEYKRGVRRVFHHQLKRLWEITPFLRTGERSGPGTITHNDEGRVNYKSGHLAQKFALYGWNFVPLVTKELGLTCWIDILFLRRQAPGGLLNHKSDIDNRLKTLFDCLQIPDAHQEYESNKPASDEIPFFCLLENDRLISKITVETDLLLEELPAMPDKNGIWHPARADENDARLIVTVRIRPFEMHLGNMQFG